jgi:ATP-dependent Clp protease protease subunit
MKMIYVTFSFLLLAGCSDRRIESFDNESFVDHLTDSAVAQSKSIDYEFIKTRKIVLTSGINPVSSREVIEKLLYLDTVNNSDINIFISTRGGFYEDGFAIFDVIRSIKSKVNIHAIGNCTSTGVFILQAATGKRIAHKYSSIEPHFNFVDSNDEYSHEKIYRVRSIKVLTEKAKLPEKWFENVTDTTYYLSPDEALKFGLIDEIQ